MTQPQKQQMLADELFNAVDEELVSERNRMHQLVSELNSPGESNPEKRQSLIKALFGEYGKDDWVESPVYCDYGYLISVDDNVFIHYNGSILDSAKATISDNVLFGPRVRLYVATHANDPAITAQGLAYSKEVVLDNGVWFGGSVATRRIQSSVVVAGNPCKVINQITISR